MTADLTTQAAVKQLVGSIDGVGALVGVLKEEFVPGVKNIWKLDTQGGKWSLDKDDDMTWELDFLG